MCSSHRCPCCYRARIGVYGTVLGQVVERRVTKIYRTLSHAEDPWMSGWLRGRMVGQERPCALSEHLRDVPTRQP